jgi:hypothetical protein
MRNSRWLKLLAFVNGSVNEELLLRNEYLAAENQIFRAKLPRLGPKGLLTAFQYRGRLR